MGFDFGNSLFCTTFEGSASEHFSWFVCNQWVSSDGIKWPYQNLGRSDDVNWLNYCYADISFGNWTLTLGKDFISTGGFELDNWDWDVYSAVSSPYFDGLSCYQWGAKLSYTIPSETNTFSLRWSLLLLENTLSAANYGVIPHSGEPNMTTSPPFGVTLP